MISFIRKCVRFSWFFFIVERGYLVRFEDCRGEEGVLDAGRGYSFIYLFINILSSFYYLLGIGELG